MHKVEQIYTHFSFTSLPRIIVLHFLDDIADWQSRWIESTYKGAEAGHFDITAGKFYGDAEKDKGVRALAIVIVDSV